MSRKKVSGVLIMFATIFIGIASVRAGNEGQEELDQATEKKLSARTLVDLAVVIELCDSAIKKGLDEGNLELANELLASTLIQRGVAVAGGLLKIGPVHANWRQFRSFALKDLERAVKIRPNHAMALYTIAELEFFPGGDVKRGRSALDDSIKASKENPDMLAKLLVFRSEHQEDVSKKLADLNAAMKALPHHAPAFRSRALVYAHQKKTKKALADFDKALELEADHLPTFRAKADLLITLKRFEDAQAVLEQASASHPESAIPWIQRARINGLQKKYEEALVLLKKAEELDPVNPLIFLFRAGVYAQLDRSEEALADLERVLKFRPNLPQALRLKAAILAGEGKFPDAIKQLEKLSRTVPDDREVMLQLAIIYGSEDRSRESLEMFNQVLKAEPDHLIALRGRADVLLSTGKQAEAIADYEKAFKIDPKEINVLNNLAWVLATSPDEKLRNADRAIELATEACELTKFKKAYILSTLAAAYAEAGDFDKAIEWSKKAVTLSDEEHKEELEAELESFQDKKPWRELKTSSEPTLPGLEDHEEKPGEDSEEKPGEELEEEPGEEPEEKPGEDSEEKPSEEPKEEPVVI